MSKFADFIVEIGTEELPPKELSNLANAFADSLINAISTAGLGFKNTRTFAAPRRLAVLIEALATEQPDQTITKRGPALNAAYNADGSPTKAALGFAASCGVTLAELSKQETDKGTWLYFEQQSKGKPSAEILPQMVNQALSQLPIKKPMRWGTGAYAFVRPVHWILMLLDKQVVPAKIFGLDADCYTYGHRILSPKPIKIKHPQDYAQQLAEDGKVIADFKQRQQMILDGVNKLATTANGTAVIEPELLNMVTGLVEYPVPLFAGFSPEFLRVPKECLISSMQDHQKCFAIVDAQGQLLPQFILVSNIESTDPKTVIRGNELVMHARLADAAFYFDKDQQQPLESRLESLKNVVYQKKLGSIYDKVQRIKNLSTYLAPFTHADKNNVARAAELCKSDLLTSMVYEFPELQGIMGAYYAKHDQENTTVAQAIQEHYQPRFAQDLLPASPAGICLALADRIDSLVGFFAIDMIPTGEKDPYALRRQAIAILRIIIEKNLDLDLGEVFAQAHNNYLEKLKNPTEQLVEFCYERLKAWYLTNGVPAKAIEAVLAVTRSANPNSIRPLDFDRRISAVVKFQALDAALALAAANKRVQNLLEKNINIAQTNVIEIETKLLETPAEQDLFAALQKQEQKLQPLQAAADYAAILNSLSTLQAPVDNFFTNVMVMVEDEKIRNNRLRLLLRLQNLFLQVADVSLL